MLLVRLGLRHLHDLDDRVFHLARQRQRALARNPGYLLIEIGDPGGLVILCTGLGAVDSTPANGAASLDKLRTATTTPTVLIGGKAATVFFAGLSPQFVGVNQINVSIPAGTPTGDKISLQISLGGVTTSADITMAVSN